MVPTLIYHPKLGHRSGNSNTELCGWVICFLPREGVEALSGVAQDGVTGAWLSSQGLALVEGNSSPPDEMPTGFYPKA